MATALLTGATGYIGSNLAQRLSRLGWDVHVIVRSTSRLGSLSSVLDSLTVHEYDGTSASLHKIVELSGAEIVFHLASVFLASHKPTDVSRLIEGNIEFATQLVDAMIAHNVSKLINTGTSWQYYQSEEYNPVNLYAATKQAFESILQYYIEACGLSVATLLLYDTYGPRDPRAKLISVLWECALSQRPLRMSPGAQLIDLVYIDDVLDAFVRVVDVVDLHECGHRHFSVSSGNPVSLRKIVAIFEEVSGLPISVDWGERPYRFREVMCPYVGYKPVPGWKAKVALREGLPLSNPELVPED